jgi:hypothetical protein
LKGDLLNILALQDLGEEKIKLTDPVIWGANLSIRSSMFQKYGVFDPTLGNIGGKFYGGEETKFIQLLIEKGEIVIYCPNVLVHHCIPGFRMKKSYFRKWIYDKGELKAIQMGEYRSRNIRGIPLYLIREAGGDFIRYLGKQVSSPPSAFHEQLILIHKVGMMLGRGNIGTDRHVRDPYGPIREQLMIVRIADQRDSTAIEEYIGRAEWVSLYHGYRWCSVIEECFGHKCHYLLCVR